MGKAKLNLILSNQIYFYNKNGLVYKPNKSFSNIFHAKNKFNRHTFKYNFCNKLGHLEPYCSKLNDLKSFKINNFRSIKITNTLGSKNIWIPKMKN